MPLTTITSKGQVTIPKAIRDELGLSPGDRVRFTRQHDGTVIVEPETVDVRSLKGMFSHAVDSVVSLEDMDRAIAEAAAESSAS